MMKHMIKDFDSWNEIPAIPLETLDRRIFTGEKVMLVHNTVAPGAVIPLHSHSHEQVLFILAGACDVTVDGKTRHLEQNGLALFPSGAEHSVINTEDIPLIALDVFSPIREDFLE